MIAFAALTVLAGASTPATAEYQTVARPLEQWLWLRDDSGVPMTAAVVRPDGWLVVATAQRYDAANERMVGGGMFLVPPWGGKAIPFGDPPDPKTKAFAYTSLVVRDDRIFGLTSMAYGGTVGQRAALVELDLRTGRVVAFHGEWWFPDLAVDPKTNDLVLWNFACTGRCNPADVDVDEADEEVAGTITHQLVRYDPGQRKTTAVLVRDAKEADPGGSGTCAARRDSLTRCEEVFRIAFSADGEALFLGTARNGSNAIDVRTRDGAFRYSIPAGLRPIDTMRYGAPSTCLAGTLVYTAFDGSTWAIPNPTDPAAANRNPVQLAAGAPVGVSGSALTPEGNLVTLRRSEAVLLSCPGEPRPAPPVPVVAPPPPAAAAGPVTPTGSPPPAAPSVQAAPPAPPAPSPPPVQPPSLPAVAGPSSHATQAVTSVNVGLADAQEEQPVYGLSASRLGGGSARELGLGAVGVGAIAVVGFAAVAFFVIPDKRRSPAAAARPVPHRGSSLRTKEHRR